MEPSTYAEYIPLILLVWDSGQYDSKQTVVIYSASIIDGIDNFIFIIAIKGKHKQFTT